MRKRGCNEIHILLGSQGHQSKKDHKLPHDSPQITHEPVNRVPANLLSLSDISDSLVRGNSWFAHWEGKRVKLKEKTTTVVNGNNSFVRWENPRGYGDLCTGLISSILSEVKSWKTNFLWDRGKGVGPLETIRFCKSCCKISHVIVS